MVVVLRPVTVNARGVSARPEDATNRPKDPWWHVAGALGRNWTPSHQNRTAGTPMPNIMQTSAHPIRAPRASRWIGGEATMIMPFTASDEDGPASPSRRRALADCAGLVATTCFASWNRCAAATGTPKGELFAFKAPGGRDLVFALALAPESCGQSERDPLTVPAVHRYRILDGRTLRLPQHMRRVLRRFASLLWSSVGNWIEWRQDDGTPYRDCDTC